MERLAVEQLRKSGISHDYVAQTRLESKVETMLRQVTDNLLNTLNDQMRPAKTAGMTPKQYVNTGAMERARAQGRSHAGPADVWEVTMAICSHGKADHAFANKERIMTMARVQVRDTSQLLAQLRTLQQEVLKHNSLYTQTITSEELATFVAMCVNTCHEVG